MVPRCFGTERLDWSHFPLLLLRGLSCSELLGLQLQAQGLLREDRQRGSGGG